MILYRMQSSIKNLEDDSLGRGIRDFNMAIEHRIAN